MKVSSFRSAKSDKLLNLIAISFIIGAVLFLVFLSLSKQSEHVDGSIKTSIKLALADIVDEYFFVHFHHVNASQAFELLTSHPEKLLKRTFVSPEHPLLEIKMKFEDFQKIAGNRMSGLATRGPPLKVDEVDAVVSLDGQAFDAKVKLRSASRMHWWRNDQWSLAISIKDGGSIWGFRKFNLSSLVERQFPYEPIFQFLAKSSGFIGAPYELARVVVNGQSWRTMLVEEQLGKDFIEKQRRKDSIIIRHDPDNKLHRSELNANDMTDADLFLKPYESKRLKKNRRALELYVFAYDKIRLVRQDRHDPSALYDLDSHFNALARSFIWGSSHALQEHNIRHYVNPYTLRLEVIASDQDQFAHLSDKEMRHGFFGPPFGALLARADATDRLYTELARIEEAIPAIDAEVTRLCELPLAGCSEINGANLSARIQFVRQNLTALIEKWRSKTTRLDLFQFKVMEETSDYPVWVHVDFYESGVLKIFNLIPHQLELLEVKYSCDIRLPTCTTNSLNANAIIIPPRKREDVATPTTVNVPSPANSKAELELSFKYRDKVKKVRTSLVLPELAYNPFEHAGLAGLKASLSKESFNIKGKSIRIRSGDWIIRSPINLPEGYSLSISKGTNLKFSKDSYLLLRGTLTVEGTPSEPVVFSALNKSWKGIYVVESKGVSQIQHAQIQDVDFFSDGLLQLTGGVNFYRSDVHLDNIKFIRSYAEDALNIVESKFSIENSNFAGTKSDAFDIDFSEGIVANSEFKDVGGDALDFSGSEVAVTTVRFSNIFDKALSVGENSNVSMTDISIHDAGTGIATKDGSISSVKGLKASQVRGFVGMAYNKKPIFGPGKLKIDGSKISAMQFKAQLGSHIILNGSRLEESDLDVKAMYSSGSMVKEAN